MEVTLRKYFFLANKDLNFNNLRFNFFIGHHQGRQETLQLVNPSNFLDFSAMIMEGAKF